MPDECLILRRTLDLEDISLCKDYAAFPDKIDISGDFLPHLEYKEADPSQDYLQKAVLLLTAAILNINRLIKV